MKKHTLDQKLTILANAPNGASHFLTNQSRENSVYSFLINGDHQLSKKETSTAYNMKCWSVTYNLDELRAELCAPKTVMDAVNVFECELFIKDVMRNIPIAWHCDGKKVTHNGTVVCSVGVFKSKCEDLSCWANRLPNGKVCAAYSWDIHCEQYKPKPHFIDALCDGLADVFKAVTDEPKQHVHHKEIIAWANGAEIELQCFDTGSWFPCASPTWQDFKQYRVKPEFTDKEIQVNEVFESVKHEIAAGNYDSVKKVIEAIQEQGHFTPVDVDADVEAVKLWKYLYPKSVNVSDNRIKGYDTFKNYRDLILSRKITVN